MQCYILRVGLAAEFPVKLVLTGNLVSNVVVFPRQDDFGGETV
jgi:hypothetical protein